MENVVPITIFSILTNGNRKKSRLLVKANKIEQKSNLQKGILSLDCASISGFKAKERQSAQVLQEVGLSAICWFRKETVRNYLCPVDGCLKYYFELYSLKNHYLKAHNGKPYKCDFKNCEWSFANKSKLERHKNSHFNHKGFTCENELCDKTFTTSYNLRQHLKSVHQKGNQFVCEVEGCQAAFHNQRSLDLHKVNHTNLAPSYRCDQEGCNKAFVTRNALCSHMRSHEHKPEDLRCPWEGCNKSFELPCRLREHKRTHTGDKPFRCDHPGCSWSFYSCSKLHRHKNKHLQIRKFVCCIDQCNKSFLRSQHLKEHVLTHSKSNTKCFFCPEPQCDTRFGSRNLLYKHVKKVHREQSLQKVDETNIFPNQYHLRVESDSEQKTTLSSEYDVCSSENVPLTAHLPELMSSELLVAMTSIESTNGDSLVDMSSLESPPTAPAAGALIDLASMESSNNDSLVVTDASMRLVVDITTPNKVSRKMKANSGSARTNYTYQDITREKVYKSESESNRKIKLYQPGEDDSRTNKRNKNVVASKQTEDLQNCKISILPDLVLGAAGMSDPQSLIVKDELYTQKDLQVLLLDQNIVRHPNYEPSTINLRDLE